VKRLLLPFVGAAVVAASTIVVFATSQQQPAPAKNPAPASQDAPVFKAGVELVNLSVTVTDAKGRNVTDLKKEDFIVYEDKKQQPVESFRSLKDPIPVPIGLGLVVDVSSSMSKDKLDAMRTAVEEMLNGRLKKDDEVYYVEFASDTRLMQPWTSDRKAVINLIRKIKTRDGTAIYDAIMSALPLSAMGKHKKQVMLVLTDGEDTSSKTPRAMVAEKARATDVVIYALVLDQEEGLGNRANTTLRQAAQELAQVTDATGGRTHYVQGFQQFEDKMAELGKEFTQQYEIGYIRPTSDGKFHEVVVGVARKDVTVRHRRTYLAAD
jgi:Ca-activated chloride channel homolog